MSVIDWRQLDRDERRMCRMDDILNGWYSAHPEDLERRIAERQQSKKKRTRKMEAKP